MDILSVAEPATLGESPYWDVETQTLYWVDIIGQTVHAGEQQYKMPEMVGHAIPRKEAGLVVSLHT